MQDDYMRQQQQQQHQQNFQSPSSGSGPKPLMSTNFPPNQQSPQMPNKPSTPGNNSKLPSLMSLMAPVTDNNGSPQQPPPQAMTTAPNQAMPMMTPLMTMPPTLSDFSRPPPGFPIAQPIVPAGPPKFPANFASQYYSLPAGIMVPLVKVSQPIIILRIIQLQVS